MQIRALLLCRKPVLCRCLTAVYHANHSFVSRFPCQPFFRLTVAMPTILSCVQVGRAMKGLYTAWLAVLATMRIKFARTLAIGTSVGQSLKVRMA
jgi:hypothetical protein